MNALLIRLFCLFCLVTELNALEPHLKSPYSELTEVLPYYMLSLFNNEDALRSLIAQTQKPQTIIEVGSYLGASTACFASLTGSTGRVYAIDWWQGLNYAQLKQSEGNHQTGWGHKLPENRQMYDQFLSNMIHLGIANIVYPVRGLSTESSVLLSTNGVHSADLVYLDADHSYMSVLADCRVWYPFVSNGRGILCGDDWGWSAPHLGDDYIEGVQRAVTEFAEENKLIIHTNGAFWWLEETKNLHCDKTIGSLEENICNRFEDECGINYFSNTLVKCKIDSNNLHRYIVNPLMGYYLCDQFIGDEYWSQSEYIGNKYWTIPDGYDILKNGFKGVNHLDVIYVQVDYFPFFCEEVLPQIDKKFILITGQFAKPQLKNSSLTENVLNNEYLHFWFSQNPIYDDHPKYGPFPYGICIYTGALEEYVNILLKNNEIFKTHKLIHLYISKSTNACRTYLPDSKYYPPKQFYELMSNAQFILSPIGDRHDCFRHWEAIGLGTIPISNVPDVYKSLFKKNMIYVADTHKMVDLLQNSSELNYTEPDRNIICVEYWKDIIQNFKRK